MSLSSTLYAVWFQFLTPFQFPRIQYIFNYINLVARVRPWCIERPPAISAITSPIQIMSIAPQIAFV